MYISLSKSLNMKISQVLAIVCIGFASCKQANRPLQVYNLKIKQVTLNIYGSKMVDNLKKIQLWQSMIPLHMTELY